MKGVWLASILALAVASSPATLVAQNAGGTVTGRVLENGTLAPLSDVHIIIGGTQRGAQTDAAGRYTIANVPAGSQSIIARRVGLGAQTRVVSVAAGQTVTVDFTLSTVATTLTAVTVNAVTGQQQTRLEAGTNIGHIQADSIEQGAVKTVSDVLQGRVAGVNLQTAAGTEGASQRIRIRGANSLSLSNEPLIYVDGVQISNGKGGFSLGGQDYSRLNDINPEEIESVEVLKGPAAAAIYGSSAANGVILFTTKKGRAGPGRVSAFMEGGWSKDVSPYPMNFAALSVFDSSQPHYDIPDGGILNIRTILGSSAGYDICPNYRAGIPTGQTIGGLTTCSQDAVLSFNQLRDPRTTPFQTGTRSKGGAAVSGGSEALTYFLSGDGERDDGVLRPNTLTKASLRSNFSARINPKTNVSVNIGYIKSNTSRLSNDNSIFSPLINGLLGTAEYIPGMETDTAGTPGSRLGSYFGYNTPDQRLVTALQGVDRFIVGGNADFTPLSWLRFNGNAGLDYYSRFDQQTIDPNELPLAQSYILGFREATRANGNFYTSNVSAAANFNLRSSITTTTTVGAAYQRNLFQSEDCYGVGIPAGTRSCAATTSQFAVDESQTDDRTVSGFAKEDLAFADKLFLTGSIRSDNNSGLVSGLAYFPQFNASYLISNEGFFPHVPALSSLRLRAGIGQAGLRPAYGTALTYFNSTAVQSNNTETPALVLNNTGNSNLKIERTTETEGGFDAGLFGNQVNLEYTLFERRSKDALISVPLAPSAGLTGSVFQNLGSVLNSGQELGLDAQLLNRRNLSIAGRFQATILHNKIEKLGAGIPPIVFNRGAQAHREGYPTGGFFALPITYNDADHNGKLTRNEVFADTSRVLRDSLGKSLGVSYIGPSLPTNTQSLGFDVTLFKLLTVSSLFERRAGNYQLNETEYFRCRTQNANPYYGECSGLSNPTASLQSQAAFIGAQYISATPAGYIEDARFVKWRELTFRVDLPQSMANRFTGGHGAALSLSGRNLHTWTKYTGIDPEINETGGGSNFTQDEFNTQPPVRTWTIRFDVKP
ncbi:MAG: SusC/RagA family TonB-linked outer membrane protein [Gemmatimonadaceae bacterium]